MTGSDEGNVSSDQLVNGLLALMRDSGAAGISFQQVLAEAEQLLGDETDWSFDPVFAGNAYSGSEDEHAWRLNAAVVRWNQRGEPKLMSLTNAELNAGIQAASARMFASMDEALDELCALVIGYATAQRGDGDA